MKANPSYLKEEIQKLETKIETEAPPFEEEKKIMKRINILKKQAKEFATFQGIFDKAHEISEKINKAKDNAQKYHNQLQEISKKSKESFRGLMDTSEKIADLKIQAPQ